VFFPNGRDEIAKGALYVRGANHLRLINEVMEHAREILVIETPWIRGNPAETFIEALPAVLSRGVQVKVFFGYSAADALNDPVLVSRIRQLLGPNLVRIPTGTHEKVLVVDETLAIVGSWNWLSNGGCTRRRELSVFIRGTAAKLIATDYRRLEAEYGKSREGRELAERDREVRA
jgi:phosphatidylserine/phosphatidylglycerophosphate/cardiolipin synthase-like enzyme